MNNVTVTYFPAFALSTDQNNSENAHFLRRVSLSVSSGLEFALIDTIMLWLLYLIFTVWYTSKRSSISVLVRPLPRSFSMCDGNNCLIASFCSYQLSDYTKMTPCNASIVFFVFILIAGIDNVFAPGIGWTILLQLWLIQVQKDVILTSTMMTLLNLNSTFLAKTFLMRVARGTYEF